MATQFEASTSSPEQLGPEQLSPSAQDPLGELLNSLQDTNVTMDYEDIDAKLDNLMAEVARENQVAEEHRYAVTFSDDDEEVLDELQELIHEAEALLDEDVMATDEMLNEMLEQMAQCEYNLPDDLLRMLDTEEQQTEEVKVSEDETDRYVSKRSRSKKQSATLPGSEPQFSCSSSRDLGFEIEAHSNMDPDVTSSIQSALSQSALNLSGNNGSGSPERYLILDLGTISQSKQNKINNLLLNRQPINIAYNYKLLDRIPITKWKPRPPYIIHCIEQLLSSIRPRYLQQVTKSRRQNWFRVVCQRLQRISVNFCGVYHGILLPVFATTATESYVLVGIYREACILGVAYVPLRLANKQLKMGFRNFLCAKIRLANILAPPNSTIYGIVGCTLMKTAMNLSNLIRSEAYEPMEMICHSNALLTTVDRCYYTVFDRSLYVADVAVHYMSMGPFIDVKK